MHNDLSSFINSFGQFPGSAVQGIPPAYSVQSSQSYTRVFTVIVTSIDDLEGAKSASRTV